MVSQRTALWRHRVPRERDRDHDALPQSAPLGRSMWKLVVGMLTRVTISVTILFAAYYLVPTKGTGEDSDLPWLILDLVIFG